METVQQNNPADELDLVIGELEVELPSTDYEANPVTCAGVYCDF